MSTGNGPARGRILARAQPAAPPVACAVILAGGRGQRMGGADKAQLPLGGVPLIVRCVARLAPQAAGLAIAVGAVEGAEARFAALPPPLPGLPRLPDPFPDRPGPLAGILAGMDWARAQGADRVLTVAVDTPFFPTDLAARLTEAARHRPRAPVLAASASGRHPVFGLWPVTLAEALRAALAGGERRVRAFAESHGAEWVRFEGGPPDPFLNLNRPEDWSGAQRLLD